METNNKRQKKLETSHDAPQRGGGSFFRNILFKNMGIKIAALFFSMVLWGVVLTSENLPRVKTVSDVPVHFPYEQELQLQAKDLVVRGNPLENFGIDFRVSTPITSYRDLSRYYLSARIDLSEINAVGTYPMRITPEVTMADSDVKSITPNIVEVEIDFLEREKEIPILMEYIGNLPEGYWHDEPVLTQRGQTVKSVFISGPRTDVQDVARAVCEIQLYNLKGRFNEAVTLIFEDAEGNEIDSSLFLDGEISVNVNMNVLPMKRVPVDVEGSLVGMEDMNQNFEITGMKSEPAYVNVVGEKGILDDVTGVLFDWINIADAKESIVNMERALLPVNGVRLFYNGEEIETTDVSVYVSEKRVTRTFEGIAVSVLGLERSFKSEVLPGEVNVTVQGRISLVNRLDREDITVYVDLTGRGMGVGTLSNQELLVRFNEEADNDELIAGTVLGVNDVMITIDKR